MKRIFCEFLVSRSLDRQRPVASWLRRVMLRDEPLRQFAEDADQLDQQLRFGAAARREAIGLESANRSATVQGRGASRTHSHERRHAVPRLPVAWLAVAAAAALLIAGLFAHHTREQQIRAARAELLSQQLTAVPNEMLGMLNRAAAVSQSEVARYSPVGRWSLPEFSPWQQVAYHVQSPIERNMDLFVGEWNGIAEVLQSRLRSATGFQQPLDENGI